ncbi:hypothetical protein [Stratiformator vulcanicus]|uniref:Uncharacterized protein n=1 Tax=Stratiformator vulcanicus TaxID=2527980 RepID=A0A517QYU3_9PLAN|nr:hypothetical protein [Stratiformator vulcanicus]QDT36802.1 hypothetical protein Pan189_11650 [Stratiformator vulcanicus]
MVASFVLGAGTLAILYEKNRFRERGGLRSDGKRICWEECRDGRKPDAFDFRLDEIECAMLAGDSPVPAQQSLLLRLRETATDGNLMWLPGGLIDSLPELYPRIDPKVPVDRYVILPPNESSWQMDIDRVLKWLHSRRVPNCPSASEPA